MNSRSKFILLVVLSALLGVGLWVFDKSRKGEGPFAEPIVVDVNAPAGSGTNTGTNTGTGGSSGLGTANGAGAGTGSAASGLAASLDPNGVTRLPTDPNAELFVPPPTAKPEIEAFDAYVTDAGIVLEWISGDESSDAYETIGYRVYRVAADGSETLVADMTTAASGAGELYNLTESGKDGGHFVIDRVNRDLSLTRLPFSSTARMVAPPEDGLHVIMIQAESGEAEIDVGSDPRNLFIIGFQNKPVVEDRSDPDNPRVLVGESISLRGEQAVYFKADSFTTIRVTE